MFTRLVPLAILGAMTLLGGCDASLTAEQGAADQDGDGVPDAMDAFPHNPRESADTDGDGVGDADDNCVDLANSDQANRDRDWLGDACDDDRDGDGVPNAEDAFPDDVTEWADTDGDGVGDNSDAFPNDPANVLDTDGDGVGDAADAFPSDPSETLDTDGDGVGDNADAFPSDPTETLDTDGDGVGDNADVFPSDPNETLDADGDGVGDNADVFPTDPSETLDTDGDGVGDNSDAFPSDLTETLDTDGDGVGDNGDNCRVIANFNQANLDLDAFGDLCDDDVDGDGVLAGEDCDDRDAAVHPGAVEIWYDGVDQDCSGGSDYDQDGDGEEVQSHAGPDCDDTNALVNTSAAEVCDGVDNNCTGSVDDGASVGSASACGAASCGAVLTARPGANDGSYWLKPDNGSAFRAYCDMANGGWTLLLAADGSSTFFGNNSVQWTTSGEYGVLPTGNFAAADYRSPAYDRFTTQAVRLCFADHSACHTFQHNKGLPLMSFFTLGESYVEYSADSYGYGNVGSIASWNTYAAEVGVAPNNGVCRWLGINDTLSGSSIGALGDNNGGCSTRTGSVRYHDDIALGLGLQSCQDANGCSKGGAGHTAGRIAGVAGYSGDLGPWFVFGR